MGRPRKNPIVEEPIDDNVKQVSEVVDEVIEEVKPNSDDNFDGTSFFNPFNQNVVERDYASPTIADGVIEEIQEPSFTSQSYEDIIAERQGEFEQQKQDEPSPFQNPNPAMENLSNEDQRVASENMVDSFLFGYEQLHTLAINYTKISEDKLIELKTSDSLDFNETIPVSEDGEEITIGEFFGSYNEQVEKSLSYEKSFGERVRPIMVRVFMSKGWGMTDTQTLILEFGKDIVTKATQVFSLKKTLNTTIDLLVQAHTDFKSYNKGRVREDEYDVEAVDEDESYEMEEVEKVMEQQQPPAEVKEEFEIDYPKPMKQEPLPKDIQDIKKD